MTDLKLGLVLAGTLVLGACANMGAASGPALAGEEARLPTTWYAPPLPHQGQKEAMAEWWARMGDPQLPALIGLAQNSSPSLEAARAQVMAARAAQAGADSSLLPQVGLTASAYRGENASAPLGTGMNVGLQASWSLDLWGQNASASRQASAQLGAAQAGWHEARVVVAAETARLYLGWRACLAQRSVTGSDLASRAATAKSAAETERAGLLAPATAALARAGQADAEARLAQQTRACEQQFKGLVALVGLPEPALRERLGGGDTLPDPSAAGSALSVAAVPLEVVRQRPDVARAQLELVAAAEGVGVARAALWPSLSLVGSVLRNRFTTGGETTSFNTWSVGPLTLNLPLIGRAGLSAAAQAAQARYEASAVAYAGTLRQAVSEVERALVALDALRTQQRANREAVDGYTRSLNATMARYRVGLANLNELEDARRLKLAADSGAVALQLDQINTWIDLYVALGGGFDPTHAPPMERPAS
ncbi:MAG: efflux transporter outer membrane subunit [Hydrogenophaga sp.]|nr:efflux transporter outer membrane subunit [Hydrogenophaga sp.]